MLEPTWATPKAPQTHSIRHRSRAGNPSVTELHVAGNGTPHGRRCQANHPAKNCLSLRRLRTHPDVGCMFSAVDQRSSLLWLLEALPFSSCMFFSMQHVETRQDEKCTTLTLWQIKPETKTHHRRRLSTSGEGEG
jgi:hypothetical protein